MTLRPDLTPPVTRASIMDAWLAAQAERDLFARRHIGLTIDASGHIVRRHA